MSAESENVIHQLAVGGDAAFAEIIERAHASDDVTTLVAAALFGSNDRDGLMARAATLAPQESAEFRRCGSPAVRPERAVLRTPLKVWTVSTYDGLRAASAPLVTETDGPLAGGQPAIGHTPSGRR